MYRRKVSQSADDADGRYSYPSDVTCLQIGYPTDGYVFDLVEGAWVCRRGSEWAEYPGMRLVLCLTRGRWTAYDCYFVWACEDDPARAIGIGAATFLRPPPRFCGRHQHGGVSPIEHVQEKSCDRHQAGTTSIDKADGTSEICCKETMRNLFK